MDTWTGALMKSLRGAPLLVHDLPGAPRLDRLLLGEAQSDYTLNFNQKLGHLYEDALEHLLEESSRLSLLSSHFQVVNESGRTLGEMDFLLRDDSAGCDYHLELAVKFYLAVRDADGWSYPGPDARDNWQRKLNRMQTHQLRLTEDPHAKQLLAERFGINKLSVRQLIYGRLFVPFFDDTCPLPEGMAPGGLRGRWLYIHQWSQGLPAVSELRVIPKALWPVVPSAEWTQELPLVNQATLFKLASERCTLFLADDSLEPIFLVPNTWPNTEAH